MRPFGGNGIVVIRCALRLAAQLRQGRSDRSNRGLHVLGHRTTRTTPQRLWQQSLKAMLSTSRGNPTATDPTIYALSTAPGKAAIAVIRISGRACADIYHALCPGKALPQPRHAALRSIHEPSSNPLGVSTTMILDPGAIVLHLPGPKTVTGEHVLEFHVHGGPAIVSAVLAAVGKCSTSTNPVRYAEPGEFTRRAFLNDRLDLTQVEALGETISAVTEEQRRVAIRGTNGSLAARYESWRGLLLHARGELEALIDFSEDQHFDESPATLAASVAVKVRALENLITYHSSNAMRGELLRNGISISLIGAPNAGKSSLLNLIVGRNAAIVSKEAGTTRDIVEIGLDLGGFFCRLGDTAGLRQAASEMERGVQSGPSTSVGEVEKEGIRRAKERAVQSDVVILVLSIETSIGGEGAQLSLDAEVLSTATQLLDEGKEVVVAVNKLDNYSPNVEPMSMIDNVARAVQTALPAIATSRVFCISCEEAKNTSGVSPHAGTNASKSSAAALDRGNIQVFLEGLVNTFRTITAPLKCSAEDTAAIQSSEKPMGVEIDYGNVAAIDTSMWEESLGATQRQRALLDECAALLRNFLQQVESQSGSHHFAGMEMEGNIDIVVAAEYLRSAADCLAKITGRGQSGDVEEVLGVVFEHFCVGK